MRISMLARYLPVLDWGQSYNRQTLINDGLAACIVTIMLIPQSLAYAMLAGLPPEVGLYASILPIIAYAIFGTSRTLAVGPVAVISLMTLAAAGSVAPPGSAEFVAAALVLALLSGLILTLMGMLKLGFLANLLSHPVVSGFITASGIIIATSQLKSILGIAASGEAMPELLTTLASNIGGTNLPTVGIGVASLTFLFWVRKGLKPTLMRLGIPGRPAELIAKTGPIAAVVASTLAVVAFDLERLGVKVVGEIPRSLPPFTVPLFDPNLWQQLLVPALLLSVIGFVESVSVAQTLAAKRRQRIEPDQELIGLGAANIAASFSGGYPVTGGFARSVVNFDAGAETPAAGAMTAIGIAIAALRWSARPAIAGRSYRSRENLSFRSRAYSGARGPCARLRHSWPLRAEEGYSRVLARRDLQRGRRKDANLHPLLHCGGQQGISRSRSRCPRLRD